MKRTRVWTISAAGILVAAVAGWQWREIQSGHSRLAPKVAVVHSLFTDRGIEIIQHPDRVETYQLGGLQSHLTAPKPEENRIDGYTVTSRGSDLDAEASRRYADKLLDEQTYQVNEIFNCAFDPHQAWRFIRGNESVDVLICFHCEQIQVTVYDATGKEVHSRGAEFDTSYAGF